MLCRHLDRVWVVEYFWGMPVRCRRYIGQLSVEYSHLSGIGQAGSKFSCRIAVVHCRGMKRSNGIMATLQFE